MIRNSRFAATIGLVVALSVSAIAFADGVSENEADVQGAVIKGQGAKPKLDQKEFKPVSLFVGLTTTGEVTGSQQNPEAEYISFPKNVKLDQSAAPTCDAQIEFQPTEAAKAACPKDSNLGSGEAEIRLPGGFVSDPLTVTVFNGPGKNEVRLHTYSEQLEGATPTVFGKIVKSNKGTEFGNALVVPDAPDPGDDTGKVTKFNATLKKASGVVRARCKSKTMVFQRVVTYDDNTKETVEVTQKCRRS